MEMVYFSYPRITVEQAAQVWSNIKHLSLNEIRQQCDNITVTGAEFYPFAEVRTEDDELREVRSKIIAAAIQYGYPNEASSRNKVAFESDLIGLFHDEINMSPAEAAHMDIWHFFNLKLLADITIWRFGSFSPAMNQWNITPERLYSFNRNMFGRVWWRNHLLGPELATSLGEDATVAIVERTALFSHPPFARAVARRALGTKTSISPTQLLRSAAILFSRRMAVLSIYAMDADRINTFVDDIFGETETAILTPERSSSF